MSADLPDMHRNPEAMARCLVTYIACPERVQREVRAQFGSAPCLYTIRQMRERHLKPPMATEPWKPHEGHRPDEVRLGMAAVSRRFLAALERERTRPRLTVIPC